MRVGREIEGAARRAFGRPHLGPDEAALHARMFAPFAS